MNNKETFPMKQFEEIIKDFTQAIIKDKPNDIIHYGLKYFESKEKKIEFNYQAKENEILAPKIEEKSNNLKEPEVVLDGPIEDYEKTALMMQKKFKATKLIKAKKAEKQTEEKKK